MPGSYTTEECRVVLLSPFEIHFSQTRIRTEFQDKHTVEETTPEIKAYPRSVALRESEADGGAESDVPPLGFFADAEDLSIRGGGGEGEEELMLLWTPFPRIEVTKWRCKLREADGSPKLDPATGLELYSHEERWFSFDNRRLYCLQKAASALWPREVRCEVVEIPTSLARTRELRKFDTRTFGCSVLVGKRDDPDPESWSWRAAVGLPEEAQPEDGIARQRSMRWRGARGKGPNSGGPGAGRRRRLGEEDEGQEGGSHGPLELLRSALLFFLVYLGLRLVVSLFRYRLRQTTTSTGAAGAEVPLPGATAMAESVA